MVDSETVARRCFVQACEELGWQGDPALRDAAYDRCIGQTSVVSKQILTDALGVAFPFDTMSERWYSIYHGVIHNEGIPLRPGIADLLAQLAAQEIPLAIATSSHWRSVEPKLGHLGLLDCFQLIVCGDHVNQGKPHPEPYLRATAGMQLAPSACWAIEDTETGVRSALAAGLTVFQIPDQVAPGAECVAFGHHIVDGVEDVLRHLER